VRLAETLLDRKVRVCGTKGANGCIPPYLEQAANSLKKGQSAFWRKGDIIVHVPKDKWLVQMISKFLDATIVNTGRNNTKTWK
jgi:hypothetical protein